ncbi:hypothetical protein [Cupriavidus consociatus]|uniref:hypothetical protein n=1 Tax=Cupriavidus consociatus TaxID=2821357 RepID=UPI001AE18E86|nr:MULTISPECIES: hypothetical protein [unclassified Cupriavidus]MBP0619788.1 hypothetical protein [Cupriavidus sp. LEh25]MDK2656440.1 hypothetical protein [Cupriavidus sp. LEh21]
MVPWFSGLWKAVVAVLWGANWHQALAVMMRTHCEKGIDWHQTVLDVTQRIFFEKTRLRAAQARAFPGAAPSRGNARRPHVLMKKGLA